MKDIKANICIDDALYWVNFLNSWLLHINFVMTFYIGEKFSTLGFFILILSSANITFHLKVHTKKMCG